MTQKQIILWGGWYGGTNIGDQALLLAITDLLGDRIPDVCFIALTADPGHVHSLARRDSRFEIRALNTRKEFLRVVKAFASSDLFILEAVPFFDHLPQVAAMWILTRLARLFQVPYFLWSVASLPVGSKAAKFIYGWILAGAGGITCRDEYTRELFVQCGMNSEKMIKTGDPVFLMETDSEDSVLEILQRSGWQPGMRPLVALTPRVLRGADGEAETHYIPKTKDEFQKEINTYSMVLDWLWEHDYQPIFVHMNTAGPDDDRVASRLIMSNARYGKFALIIDEEVHPRAAVAIYHHCQASFVSRVHGSIMSVKANCPVIMYAFEQKYIGIMQEMGLSDYIFYPEENDPVYAIEILRKILVDQPAARAFITQCLEESSTQSLIPLDQALRLLK